ncbi:glycoside hydrolase family 43 protein [Sphingobacterium composti Ten et al. 2007 non Yoo et al. 2007]|uniref:glycoside hydrolase family 43 protein n=1 Tax=Sphingobacterium composti TaxID=363260 RepID=UPI00135C7456|nr:glycoside hydrolase family 43 protein [Sphingobacterium composti Ten et al. 2007 non Yoo et al. 2007]
MKKIITFILTLVFCILSCQQPQQPKNKTVVSNNPLNVKFGDPYVLYDKQSDLYYMYGTGGVENGFGVYTSSDLVNWENKGAVYTNNQTKSWGIKDFWAPEVYHYNDRYYMFYSSHWKDNPNNELENYKIGVAVSNSPLGPFEDMTGAPLFDPGYPIIDANVYFSEDGRLFLYYSRCCYKHSVDSEIATWAKEKGMYDNIEESWIYGVELKADFSGVIGEPVLLLRPPVKMDDKQSEWESRSVTSGEINRRWTEGSYLFKHNDIYYMMYSANFYAGENYAVGYATSNHPLGPFTKSINNPVLEKNTSKGGVVTGTGHNSLLTDKNGNIWCVYHGRTSVTGDDRVVFMDPLQIDSNGDLTVEGPTVRTNFK